MLRAPDLKPTALYTTQSDGNFQRRIPSKYRDIRLRAELRIASFPYNNTHLLPIVLPPTPLLPLSWRQNLNFGALSHFSRNALSLTDSKA